MKTVCLFFRLSPKREGLLLDVMKRGVLEQIKRKPLLDFCRTRRAERHNAYGHFYTSFVSIVKAFEVIAHGRYADDVSEDFATGWDAKSQSEAASLVNSSVITSFDFILSFVLAYHMLSHLAGITVKLQSSTIDILEAYANVLDQFVLSPTVYCTDARIQ